MRPHHPDGRTAPESTTRPGNSVCRVDDSRVPESRGEARGVADDRRVWSITAVLLAGVVLVAPGSAFETVRRVAGLGPERQLSVRDFEPGEGSFAFLLTQRGSDEPVGYDPCRVIEYVVNTDRAPADWQQLVDTGATHTAAATGLAFEYVGTTERAAVRPAARGARRPVVIGFTDAESLPPS